MVKMNQYNNLKCAVVAFDDACASVVDIKSASDTRKARRSWAQYLMHWNRAYRFLQKAARPGSAKKIADSMVSERKRDPIIRYLYQARDSLEHVEEVVEQKVATLGLSYADGARRINFEFGQNTTILYTGNADFDELGNLLPHPDINGVIHGGKFEGQIRGADNVAFMPPHIELKEVNNRSGSYSPPFSECGPIDQMNFTCAAGIRYLDGKIRIVKEAFED